MIFFLFLLHIYNPFGHSNTCTYKHKRTLNRQCIHISKYIELHLYHCLIKTILCFIWFDQREPHIHPSNDRFMKLQTLGKISLSGLRIIFNFSRESSWLKRGYFVFIKSIKEGLSVTLQSKKKWNSSSNVLQNLQCLWFRGIFYI